MEHYFNLASRGREAKAVPASNEQARFETIFARRRSLATP